MATIDDPNAPKTEKSGMKSIIDAPFKSLLLRSGLQQHGAICFPFCLKNSARFVCSLYKTWFYPLLQLFLLPAPKYVFYKTHLILRPIFYILEYESVKQCIIDSMITTSFLNIPEE